MSDTAPDTSAALSVGDCCLRFLAQTTELDQAFARIPDQADAAMSKAADSVNQIGDAAEDAGTKLAEAADSAEAAGETISDSMEKGRSSVYEARGEAALLGEAFGVHLPRHVRTFVAELPGVGTALSAAFSATAVLFLIEALVKGSEKLADWISSTFIFTQAMKESDEAAKSQNRTLLQLAEQLDKDTEALDRFGKTQGEIKSDKVAALRVEIAKNKTLFEAAAKAARDYATAVHESKPEEAAEKLTELNGALGAIATGFAHLATAEKNAFESIRSFFTGEKTSAELAAETEKAGQAAQATATNTAMVIKNKSKELTLAEKQDLAQATSDHEEAAKRSIAIEESLGMSKIKTWASYAKYEAAFAADAAEATLKVQREEAEREYQLKLQTLGKERAAEQAAAGGYAKAGDTEKENKQIQQVKEINAKIENLTAEHDAKLKQMAMETDAALLKMHADAAVASQGMSKSLFPSLPADIRNVLSMADAAAKLGITLSTDLGKNATAAKEALALLDKEYKGGVISLRDLQSAQMKAMETQIAYDKEMGKAPAEVKAEEKALDDLRKKFDSLYPTEQKTRTFWDAFAADFKKKSHDVGEEATQMGGLMARAATQMDEAFASAVMGALASGKSIGAALEAATKQVLENLAEQALAHALYCTAMGIAELALGVTDSSAAEWFAAAAKFGLVAGAAGAAGMAMPGGGSNGGGGAAAMQGPSVGQTTSSTGGGGGSNQTGGVTHLATGGVTKGPTNAQVGEDGEEAILPLTDPDAMRKIAKSLGLGFITSPPTPSEKVPDEFGTPSAGERPSFDYSQVPLPREMPDVQALAAQFGGLLTPNTLRAASPMPSTVAPAIFDEAAMQKFAGKMNESRQDGFSGPNQAAGDTTHIHLNIKGMVSPDNAKKFLKQVNRMVSNRQATLNASNSLRITRRSQ
jgi:hypothetical protein